MPTVFSRTVHRQGVAVHMLRRARGWLQGSGMSATRATQGCGAEDVESGNEEAPSILQRVDGLASWYWRRSGDRGACRSNLSPAIRGIPCHLWDPLPFVLSPAICGIPCHLWDPLPSSVYVARNNAVKGQTKEGNKKATFNLFSCSGHEMLSSCSINIALSA